MHRLRWWCAVMTVALGVGQAPARLTAGAESEVPTVGDSGSIEVTCSPVNISWPQSAGGGPRPEGPELSVVSTDFRPKDIPLFLDGRFVGRARHFNGKKGFLYLEPGRYRLVAASHGMKPAVFSIEARSGCRFDIKHRMERGRSADGQSWDAPAGKGEPRQWVFGPVGGWEDPATAVAGLPGRADTSLRPDLDHGKLSESDEERPMASLRMRVAPASAVVLLNGRMLATGNELSKMVEPIAVPAGMQTVVVRAPGYTDRTVSFELGEGALEELEVVLERSLIGSPAD